MLDTVDNSVDLSYVGEDIKTKNPIEGNQSTSFNGASYLLGKRQSKIGLTPSNIKQSDVFTKLSSGKQIAKYPSFVKGLDNEERLAQQQSSGMKWANGLTKLAGKTGTAILGGTIGVVDGIINGITEGSLEATYNSDFNKWLDDLNTKMDYKLPNYYTEQEKDLGLFKSMGTANFWANDVTSGLSFTLGTVVSEGIWAFATGGVGTIAKGAVSATGRWGAKALSKKSALSAINKYKETAGKAILRSNEKSAAQQFLKTSANATKLSRLANNTRFLVTSAGYEAGVEARHYMKSTEENWINSFQETNGRMPTAQERAAFMTDLQSTANGVFATNLGLVGASNIAMFGKILKGKPVNRTIKNNWFRNKVLGVGYKTLDGKKVALEATRAQKIARGAYTFGKYGLLEGFVEEGGQGVISSTGENFMLDTYSGENIGTSAGLVESMIKGFEEAYGTKQGQKEIGIGFIIGLFGGGMSTNFRFNELSKEQEAIETQVEYSNAVTSDIVLNRMKELSRQQNAAKKEASASENNDLVGEQTARKEMLYARAIRDIRLGGLDSGLKDLEAYLQKTDDSQIAEAIGVEETDTEAIEQYKSEIYSEYKDIAEKTQRNLDYAEAILGDSKIAGSEFNTQELAEAIGYTLTMGEVSDEMADDIVTTIKEIVAENLGVDATQALDVENALRKVSDEKRREIRNANRRYKRKEQKVQKIQEQIVDTQNLTNREDNQQMSKKLADLNKLLLEETTELERLSDQRQIALDTANVPTLSDGSVTVDVLDNQSQSLNTLRESFKALKPQDREIVDKLLKNYENAVRQTKQFNRTIATLSNPRTRVNLLNGWLSNLINKNKKLPEELKNYLENITTEYTAQRQAVVGSTRTSSNTVQPPVTITSDTESSFIEKKKFVSSKKRQQREGGEYKEISLNNIDLKKSNLDGIEDDIGEVKKVIVLEQRGLNSDNVPVGTVRIIGENGTETSDVFFRTSKTDGKDTISKLRNNIDNIIKKDSFLKEYIGDRPLENLSLNKEDVDRYNELLSKISIDPQQIMDRPYSEGIGLTEEETNEFKELTRTLNDWKAIDGSSIGEMLRLLESLQTEVENENTMVEHPASELVLVSRAEQSEGSGFGGDVNTVVTPSEKFAKYNYETENYELSHTDIESLLDIIPNSNIEYNGKNISEVSGKQKKKIGNKFTLSTPETTTTVEIGERNRLLIKKTDMDQLLEGSDVSIVDFRINNFMPLYRNGSPMDGDFGFTSTDGSVINFDRDATNDLKKGSILTAEINLKDSFNQNLLSRYDAGKITRQELANQLNIYLKPQNRPDTIVGSMRSLYENNAATDAVTALTDLRNTAVEEVLKRDSDRIDLNINIPVDKVLLGNPNVTMDDNGNPVQIPFTNQSISKVLATGYAIDGEVVLNKNIEFNPAVPRRMSKREQNAGKKIPVVVFNYRNQNIAYPVSLVQSESLVAQQANDILDMSLPSSEKATKFAQFLIQNKIDPKQTGIDFTDPDWINSEQAQQVLDQLAAKTDFADIETWLNPDFSTTNLIRQATISVDITGTPILSSKVILKLEDIRPYSERAINQKYKNRLQAQRIGLTESLSGDLIDLELMFRDSSFLSNKDADSDFLMSMYDRDVQKTPESYIQYQSNLSILKEMFGHKIPRKVADKITREKISAIKQKIETLDKISEVEKELPLTVEQLTETESRQLGRALIGTEFSSTDQLLPSMMKAFYTAGEFNPSIASITSSGLYNQDEADMLMKNPEKLREIEELILKLQVNENPVQTSFYIDDRFISTTSNLNIIGKLETNNPYRNEQEALQILGGIQNRDEFEEALSESELDYLKKAYSDTKGTDRDIFIQFREYSKVPVKMLDGNDVVDRPRTNREYLEQVLTESSSELLRNGIDFLLGLSPITIDINQDNVSQVLDDTLDAAVDIGLDLSDQKGKSLEELRPLLQAIADFDQFNDEDSFNNLVTEYDKVRPSQQPTEQVVQLPENLRDRQNIIYLETYISEHDLYKNSNLLRVGDNLYMVVEGQELEQMYQNLFENKDLLPENKIEQPTEPTINRQTIEESLVGDIEIVETDNKGIIEKQDELAEEETAPYTIEDKQVGFYHNNTLYVNTEMYQNPQPVQREFTYQDLKDHVVRQTNNIERPSDNVDPEALEKIIISKMYFQAPTSTPSQAPTISGQASIYADPINNAEYLQSTYIADFNKESIEAKRNSPEKYDMFYSNFTIDKNGIQPLSNDPITLSEMEPYMDQNIKNYLTITGQMEAEPYNDVITKDIKRLFYLDNPKALPIFAKGYTMVNDTTIMSKESSDFIRTPDNRIYESNGFVGDHTFYSLLQRPAPTYKTYEPISRPELDIDLKDYLYLVQPASDTQVNNNYNETERQQIEDRLECD